MISRRETLKAALLGGGVAMLPVRLEAAAVAPFREAGVRWIDGAAPAVQGGQTFGVAWPRGAVKRGTALTVLAGGKAVPSQGWTTATWPDGSIKWSAHALPADVMAEALTVARGRPVAPARGVRVTESADAVTIVVGDTRWTIGRSGAALVREASVGGRAVLGPVRLVGASRSEPLHGADVPFEGRIEKVTVEQTGPVRAVVKIEGAHLAGGRRWLPFTVRLYAYAGSQGLRVVHSFVFDGSAKQDFLSALGVRASVPVKGAPLHDRHVRFATDAQLFAEGVRPLTGLRRDPGQAFRDAQVAGRAVPPVAQMAKAVASTLERIPAWGDFRLEQPTANGWAITKRTQPEQGWIDADEGHRAPGLAYVGSPQGGAAIGVRYFWQRHPTALHIDGATGDAAQLTAWLWSPEAPAMDMRPYHDAMGMEQFAAQNEGLSVTYEDYEPGWDEAGGTARTSELMLWAFAATPESAQLQALAQMQATPPQLMAEPAALHAAQVFGDWGLPDRSTPNRAAIENQLASLVDFYAGEVDRRAWYGFWSHGDVMHTYDADRHRWRYDIGGFAWDNSELSPDLWLWTQVLRTGDAKTWRFAEAMTRHTGEVDVYHLGRFKGMGTRHGVQHWSDSSKQPRVSNASYRRIFYYLTADERVGDLLRDLLTSDSTLTTVEIGRKVPGRAKQPVLPAGTIEMTFGTTWCPLAAAWLTEWERTGDARWRDRVVAGLDSIGRLPRGWMTGSAPFDLASGRFLDQGRGISISHLNAVFGAVEVSSELIRLLDVPRYRAAWLDYCRWYNAGAAEWTAKFGTPLAGRNLREGHSRLTAYAAFEEKDAALATRAAAEFLSGDAGLGTWPGDPRRVVDGVTEWPGVSTNAAAQWGLAAIQNLALVPEALDAATIVAPDAPGRRRGRDLGRD